MCTEERCTDRMLGQRIRLVKSGSGSSLETIRLGWGVRQVAQAARLVMT
jgi:hypothetical protein